MDPLADEFENVSPYNYAMNNPILMVDPTGMAADTTKSNWQVIKEVVVSVMANLSDFDRLSKIHQTSEYYSRGSNNRKDYAGYAGMTLMLDKATGARVVGGQSSMNRIFKSPKVNSLIPKRLARVIPADVNSTTLGAPGTKKSRSGFLVIEFDNPWIGLSSPINRTNPGFVGFGKTAGGAREFTIPNQVIPAGATKKNVR